MLYLRSYNLIISTQSGFRPHSHSTESILIKMTDDWLEAIDQGLFTGAIFLDSRKAFDVVNHDLLVAKLQMYGYSSSALLWFKRYLSDRRQCVNIAGTLSDNELLISGVLQGSILSPVLFLLVINDLPLTWTNRNGLFVDDATFYASASTLTYVQVQLQRDLSITATWTKDHGMAAHPQKTNYMIIGSRQKLSRCEESALSLCLDGGQLEQTQRLLGLDIDPSLYLGHHTKLILGKNSESALLFWLVLKNSHRLTVASFYLMLVLNLFLSTVSPFGEIVMQDYWMRFLKFKKVVCVLYPATIFGTWVATHQSNLY